MPKCIDCKYCIQEHYGYSNYTVEGTSVNCLLNLNPKFPVDRGYGLEPDLAYAEECTKFCAGGSVQVDCDQDDGALENYSDDAEIKELLRKRGT